jgi:DNA-binding response OmpR family regulator
MKKILIVDDDVSLSYPLANLLLEMGYDVWVAESLSEVESLIRENQDVPDLAICDYQLLGSSGIRTVWFLDSMEVSVLTFSSEPYRARKGLSDNGLNHIPIISKSTDLNEMLKIVDSILS